MTTVSAERDTIAVRFRTNMRRVGAITKLIHSNAPEMEQTGLFISEGVRADLLRMLVVFLHATAEDFIRSHLKRPNKTFTFSSSSDIEKALKRINVDVAPFADLLPGLAQMAKRRNQIVHRADLEEKQTTANEWNIVNDWELIHWHLTVSTFHYRLRQATGAVDLVEQRAHQNVESAWKQNIEFAHLLIQLSAVAKDQRPEVIHKISKSLTTMVDTLKLEPEMFLDPEGKPLEEVMKSFART